MDPEVKSSYEVKEIASPRRIPWRKVGLGSLFVLATAVALATGYFAVLLWQHYFPSSFITTPNPYENWSVYRSEAYGLGLRYPDGWEATEVSLTLVVFRPKKVGTEALPRDYIDLSVSSNAARAKTACENDRSACSFFANDIYGEQTITPDGEMIFFSRDGNDFGLTLYKYGEADLASTAEGGASKYGEADYASIFEEMGKSLRFTTEGGQEDAENP